MPTKKQMQQRRAIATFFRKFLVLFSLLLAIASVFLVFKFQQVKDFYHDFKANQSIAQARLFLEQGKIEGARIHLINAYRHRPDKQETLSLYKNILRERKDVGYLALLMQLKREMPGNEENALELLEYLDRNRLHLLTESLIPAFIEHLGHRPEVLFRISTHYAKQKKIEEAVKFIREARNLDPASPKYEALELTYNLTSPDRQIVASSIERLDRIRNSNPDIFRPITISLAEVSSFTNPQRTLSLLDEILVKDPSDWETRLRRALHAYRNNLASADLIINDLWQQASTPEQRFYVIAAAHANLPPEHASTLLDKLTARERGEKSAQQLQLMIDWENNRKEQVLSRAREQLLLEYPPYDKLIFAAWIYRAQQNIGDENSRRMTGETIKKMAQSHPEEALRVASELIVWRDPSLLANLYEGILDSSPQLSQIALTQLSNIYLATNRLNEFHNVNAQILQSAPDDSRATINFVRSAILTMQDIPRARDLAERLYQTDPGNPEHALLFAEALAAAGQADLANRIVLGIQSETFRNQPYFQNFLKKINPGSDSELSENF